METVQILTADEMQGLNDWVDLMDRLGPFAPLDEIKKKLEAAPAFVKEISQYQYLRGVYLGRLVYEGSLEDIASLPSILNGAETRTSLEEIRVVLDSAGEAERLSADYMLLQGYYEGRLIHEQLGGIRREE